VAEASDLVQETCRRAIESRLRFTVGQLGRTSIRYDYQVFDAEEEVAIEGTMTVVVLENGKPIEIPATLRASLSGEPDIQNREG